MSLPVDFKIDKIIKQIQAEIEKETGKKVSYNTVLNVLNQQVDSTIDGMSKGYTVEWKFFAKYVATKRRVEMLNKYFASTGKTPTLVDNGLIRLSSNRKGEVLAEDEFTPARKSDLYIKPENNENTNSTGEGSV